MRAALAGRPHEAVQGLDDRQSLRRVLGSALALWGVGLIAFLTVVSRVEAITVGSVVVYLSLGPVLGLGLVVGTRTARLPSFVLLGVILWTSLLGTVSSFYYDVAPITTVALCTAFVSWFGTRTAPLYALATIAGLIVAGAIQHDPALIERSIVVALATAFAVSIVGRSSDSARTAQHDREVLLHRLADESRHDELTGLGNRKLLIEQTMVVLESSPLTTVALAIIDLDGFKAVNDTHGHLVGDEVLRAVAGRLRAVVDPADTVVRIGGDEFAVLFGALEIEQDAAVELLGSICDEILVIDGRPIPIAASIGVSVRNRRTTSLEDLLAAADDEMYAEKHLRRAGLPDTLIL